MAKTTDVPQELRAFNKLFSQLEHGWNYAGFYGDWVEFLVESFQPEREGAYERLKKQYGDLDRFMMLTREWVNLQNQMLHQGGREWYDGLGYYYEVLVSRGKASILGQFFTPAEVCDLMVRINGSSADLTGKRLTVHDPCSGSGRMLLAWHALAPGNYQFAADLDPICARMTAANMAIHGCEGEAVCMDSLKLEWRFGYRINGRLRASGFPSIEPIKAEESRIMAHWLTDKAAETPVADKRGQLSIF